MRVWLQPYRTTVVSRRYSPAPLLYVMLLAAGGCASTQEFACLQGEKAAVTESLYFGTAKPGGVVSREEWTTFVDETVMPAFPEGLTSWSASGQWRMASGTIEHETSHILQLIHDGGAKKDAVIQRIMSSYKHAFQQEAVLRIRSRGCISF